MPKIKTNRSAAKRFKVTATGKIMRFKAGASHLMRKKNSKRKRRLARPAVVDKANIKNVKRLIPNAF